MAISNSTRKVLLAGLGLGGGILGLLFILSSPFWGGAIFALSYKFLLWTGWISWLPFLSFWDAILVGCAAASVGSLFLGRSNVFLTPWFALLFLGAVHNDVTASVPALGYFALLGIWFALIPTRTFYGLARNASSSKKDSD